MGFSRSIADLERAFFVGREKEIQLMQKHALGDWPWLWLHIYGPSGIGKSSLLKRFKSEISDSYYIYLDGHKRIYQKEDLLNQLTQQLIEEGECLLSETHEEEIMKLICEKARLKGGKLLFLIDEFDHWRSAEVWLVPFLSQLKCDVRMITVGRHPLTGGWLRSGYISITYSLELAALSPLEVGEYAKKRELYGKELQTLLFRFSRGVPLAMVLAAEVVRREDGKIGINPEKQVRLTGMMMEQVLQGLPSSLHLLIEGASVYLCFNEERLQAVLDEKIDGEDFRSLISIPFVIWRQDGWMLHDAVRAWVLEDVLLRKPNHYERMRRKALDQIRLEEKLNPERRESLQFDKMSLHENPLVRQICFSGHLEDVTLEECRESDLHEMLSLYSRFHQYVFPEHPEERHMEQLICPIWEVEPASFVTIRQKGRLIAFYGKVPLNEKTLKVFAEEPLFEPFLKGWQLQSQSNAFLLSFLAIEPELEEKTRGYIIHTIINWFCRSEMILIYTPLKEWFPVYELFGFEPLLWADAKSESGMFFRAFALDLTKEDFLSKLDRVLSKEPEKESKTREISMAENIPKLKLILKKWAVLPHEPAICETYQELFPNRMVKSKEGKGALIQQDLKFAIDSIALVEDERERIYGDLLRSIYIQRISPHERIAERLNLSMATYYRYLNKALEKLMKILGNG